MLRAPFGFRSSIFFVLLLYACGVGCQTSEAAQKNTEADVTKQSQEAKKAVPADFTDFGFNLYGQLDNGQRNLVFSPYSIGTAIGLTAAGTRGETYREIAEVLGLPLAFESAHTAIAASTKTLDTKAEDNKALKFNTANHLWLDKTLSVKSSYLDFIETYYGAAFERLDIQKTPNKAVERINSWVSDETNGKISRLLGGLSNKTKSVLTNAVYFLGDWAHPFNKENTEEATFNNLDDSTSEVPFMWQKLKFAYHEASDAKVITLPYKGKKFAMSLIVPDSGKFSEVRSKLDSEQLSNFLESQTKEREVELSLPRFKVKYRAELAEKLQKLGMKRLFDNPDFSRMTDSTGMAVDAVVHKGFIEVDETGTEAAAATAVTTVTSMPMKQQTVSLTVDRPFIFVLRERDTQTVLFVGQVVQL